MFDVAKYILEKCGSMTHMKLQKLCYYAQAWSLVWDEKPIFDERIQAWANGPVVRHLYSSLRGEYGVEADKILHGDASKLTGDQTDSVDVVLEFYAGRSSQYLSDLTHMERPWMEARTGIQAGERGEVEITPAAMAEYYGSL